MTVRREVIRVKGEGKVAEKVFEIEYTHHGPVVARRPGKAYAMKLPYFDQYRLPEQAYRMATARNLGEMKQALALLQLMEQNVMVATVDGDVYYVRNGRVPVRPKGFDWRGPTRTRPRCARASCTGTAGRTPTRPGPWRTASGWTSSGPGRCSRRGPGRHPRGRSPTRSW